MDKDYNEFIEEIRSVIQQEIKTYLVDNGFYRYIPAEVVTDNLDGTFKVDTVITSIPAVLNKTGEELQIGDSVLLMEKFGSNYSNCFIMAKNGGFINANIGY